MRTLPPTIDKTVNGLKAATFVPQEAIPKNKDKITGIKKIILHNKERLGSITILPQTFFVYLLCKYLRTNFTESQTQHPQGFH
jgi:hypothetical protein